MCASSNTQNVDINILYNRKCIRKCSIQIQVLYAFKCWCCAATALLPLLLLFPFHPSAIQAVAIQYKFCMYIIFINIHTNTVAHVFHFHLLAPQRLDVCVCWVSRKRQGMLFIVCRCVSVLRNFLFISPYSARVSYGMKIYRRSTFRHSHSSYKYKIIGFMIVCRLYIFPIRFFCFISQASSFSV